MDELMDKCTALTTCATVPDDYCQQLSNLAALFDSKGRHSMAARCRERAERYQYAITSTYHIACGGEPVPYIVVAAQGADKSRSEQYQEGTQV